MAKGLGYIWILQNVINEAFLYQSMYNYSMTNMFSYGQIFV